MFDHVVRGIFLGKLIQVIQDLAETRQHRIIKGFDFRHATGLALGRSLALRRQ
jgi:hypothetical protein